MLDKNDQRGFALLAVTIALAALSLIVGAVLVSTRNYVHDSVGDLERVRLRAALDAGIATAGSDLAGPGAGALHYLALPQTFRIGDIDVTISARPESTKIDLSAADPKLIAALLHVSGLSSDRAARLADEIADWRDKDGETRTHGAESSDYLGAGRSPPPNAPFETISELSRLLDANADLPVCLEPDVTIYSGQGTVDLRLASPRVRDAVKIVEPDRVAGAALSSADALLGGGASVYEVTATATVPGTQRHLSRLVVMRITGSARDPYWILTQRAPAADPKDAAAACQRLAHAALK